MSRLSKPLNIARLRRLFELVLIIIVTVLMISLAIEVLLGVVYRKLGLALSWYEDVTSITLVWLTYYGAALAALKRAHIGFPGLINAAPLFLRVTMIFIGEFIVLAFFTILAWQGYVILDILATTRLETIPIITQRFTNSVIPIGAVLFIIAELFKIKDVINNNYKLDATEN